MLATPEPIVTQAPAWPKAPAALPQTMTIDVTSTDISEGVGCSSQLCPLARALSRWLWERHVHVVQVSVSHHDAEITFDWHQPSVRYWHSAYEWISLYDAGRSVAPLTVGLERKS